MNKVKKSLSISALAQVIGIPLSIFSAAVVSRILTPAEIGIHVVAAGVFAIATEIRLLGTGGYLIRKKELTTEDCRDVLGVTIALSWFLGVLFLVLSPLLANWYKTPELRNSMAILSISFFIAPFLSVTVAVLSREFKFTVIVARKLMSSIATFASTVLYVYLGMSYLSLAMGLITGMILELILIYIARPKMVSWIPRFGFHKEILSFGVFVSLSGVCRNVSQSIPEIVLGKIGTVSQAAMFSRGTGLLGFSTKLVFSTINPVIGPYFSELKRKPESSVAVEGYLKVNQLYCGLMLPLCAVVGLAAYPAIMLIFGDQWTEAVPVAQVLSVWACVRAFKQFSSQFFVTYGFEKLNFYVHLISLIATIVLVIIGASYGLIGAAWGVVAAAVVDLILTILLLSKLFHISLFHIMKPHGKNLVVTSFCLGAAYLLDLSIDFEESNELLAFLYIAMVMPFVWFGSVWISKHPLMEHLMPMIKVALLKLKIKSK